MPTPQEAYSSEAEWGPTAANYGSNVGKTSAQAAFRLVASACELAPIDASSNVLDVGAGSGAVTIEVLTTSEAHVTASDIHRSMLDSIIVPPEKRERLVLQTADARYLTKVFEKNSFSHVFCTFMLQLVRTPVDALRQMHQLLHPSSGVIGIACWDQDNDPFDIWEKSCQSIDPSYRLPPELPFDDPNAWRTEKEVANGLREAGFQDIRTERVVCTFPFKSTDEYINFWFGRKNPTADRAMSNWEGSIEDVKRAAAKICREQYDDGRAITVTGAMGVGRA